jgi:hypothetical protein
MPHTRRPSQLQLFALVSIVPSLSIVFSDHGVNSTIDGIVAVCGAWQDRWRFQGTRRYITRASLFVFVLIAVMEERRDSAR